MSIIKDNVTIAPCVVPTLSPGVPCEHFEEPSTDPRCNDPVFRRMHPELCKAFAYLIVKPDVTTLCQFQSRRFSAFVVSQGVEHEVTQNVEWTSTNLGVAIVGPNSGNASGVGPGIAMIGAKYQDLTASAQIEVLEACCDDEKVGVLILLDISPSMRQQFNVGFGTKLNYAKRIARDFANDMDTDKHRLGLVVFDGAATVAAPIGSSRIEVLDAISAAVVRGSEGAGHNTDIEKAIEAALGEFATDQTLTRNVILLVTDGFDHSEEDPLPAALMFKEAGNAMLIVGVRAAAEGYALLQDMASGGFFLNAWDDGTIGMGTSLATINYVRGLKGYLCIGNCKGEGGPVYVGELNYDRFAQWNVIGQVDLCGGEFPYELFNIWPGHGLYVDLVGSPSPGGLYHKQGPWTLTAGTTYTLRMKLAGQGRQPSEAKDKIQVAFVKHVGDVPSDFPAVKFWEVELEWDADFAEFEFEWTPDAGDVVDPLNVRIMTVTNPHESYGIWLDDVSLVNQSSPVPPIFEDTFDTENLFIIEPPCAGILPSYDYDYYDDCYSYGCLPVAPPAQEPDPTPDEDTTEV